MGRVVLAHPALEKADDRERGEAPFRLGLAGPGKQKADLGAGRGQEDVVLAVSGMPGRQGVAEDRPVVGELFVDLRLDLSRSSSCPASLSPRSLSISARGDFILSSWVTSNDGLILLPAIVEQKLGEIARVGAILRA